MRRKIVIDGLPEMKSGGDWISSAVHKSHIGFCTPMTKSTCTPRRKAFARTMKKHHGFHEYGGEIYQGGGPWGAGTNFNQNLGYNPVLDPANQGTQIDSTGQPIVSPQSPTTALQVPNAPMVPTGMGEQQQAPVQAKRKKNYYNFGNMFNGILDVGMATGSFINGMNNARDVHSQAQQMGLTGNMSHMNQPGVKGDVVPNSGYFRPQNQTPTNTGFFPSTMQNGGYVDGSVHELPDSEIKRLKKLGYTIEFL